MGIMMGAIDQIEAYVRANPGCMADDIAAGTGIKLSDVRPYLSRFSDRFDRLPVALRGRPLAYYPKSKGSDTPKQSIAQPAPMVDLGQIDMAELAKTVAEQAPAKVDHLQDAPSPLDAAVENLVNVLVDRVTSSAEQRIAALESELSRRLEERLAESLGRATTVTKRALRRVFVGGVPNQHHSMLLREFKDCLNLKLLGPDDNLHQWKAVATSGYEVLLYVDAISHKHTDAINETGVAYTELRGGLTRLREALTDLYVKGSH